jgi:hypothetical protein
MKKLSISFGIVSLLFFASGCMSSGLTASTHRTDVQLSRANYRIVATNISGKASSDALFGASFGVGVAGNQVALIPLSSSRSLYQLAMKDMWASFETAHGAIGNRRLALVNFRYDSESLNAFIYTKVTVTVVADIIEFQE